MKSLYDLWAKIKADAVNAATIIGTMVGSAMTHVEELASTLGDPGLNQQLHTVVTDVKWWGHWVLFVSMVGAVARFKKLIESPKT